MGAKETAKRLGRTLSAIHTKIREVGGGREPIGPRVDWTQEELEYLRQNYQLQSIEDLVTHLGKSKSAIRHQAIVLGIKHYIDPYPFFSNWTEESAYTIGFFAADGNVDKRGPDSFRINFSQKEPDIIYALRDVVGTGRIITKANGAYEFYVQSTRTYQLLCKIFGCEVARKSLTLLWPSVPDTFMRHFIRGAMDGDGSLMRKKDRTWTIEYTTGSKWFAEGYKETIWRLTGIATHIIVNKLGIPHIRCAGIKAVCLASWLYKDAKIALERKAWIAREMYEHPGGQAQASSITPKMREMFPEIIGAYSIVG